MDNLGFVPAWQFNMNPAENPQVVNMAFPPGMTQSTVQPMYGLSGLGAAEQPIGGKIYGLLSLVSSVAMAYHGVKRNHGSIGYGLWWGLMGGLFPLFTPIVAIARKPGFGKPL
jgi:hypothetical protein